LKLSTPRITQEANDLRLSKHQLKQVATFVIIVMAAQQLLHHGVVSRRSLFRQIFVSIPPAQ